MIGFTGYRFLAPSFAPAVAAVVSALAVGQVVVVGDASGADAMVRSACPWASVFRASAYGEGRGSFAARSVALVRAVAAGGGALVGFVASACPAGIAPASSWRSGRPVSGSWSSLALAAGLGCAVAVVWCASGAPRLPSWVGGAWVAGGVGGVVVWSWVPVKGSRY